VQDRPVLPFPFRRNLSIVLMKKDFEEGRRWNVFGAWVAEYEVSGFNAERNRVAFERLTLQHHGFEEVTPVIL